MALVALAVTAPNPSNSYWALEVVTGVMVLFVVGLVGYVVKWLKKSAQRDRDLDALLALKTSIDALLKAFAGDDITGAPGLGEIIQANSRCIDYLAERAELTPAERQQWLVLRAGGKVVPT